MSAEAKKQLHLEIAHVLFMDVVGFSKLLINDQTETLEQLNHLVRETPHFREAEAAGKLIRLSTGDGMALVFSKSAEAPVECALEISKALKMYPQIQLRMGVHSGPVSAVSDVNDRSNVTGAGINIAQRVMDCGPACRGRPGAIPAVVTVPPRFGRMRSETRCPGFGLQSLHGGTR